MSTNNSRTPWLYFITGVLAALLIFLLGAASAWIYLRLDIDQPLSRSFETADMTLFNEAWDIIERDFFGQLPESKTRTYGAIRGSFETLNDPYTYFVEPEPAVREQEQLQGHFGGIGAFLVLDEQGRIVLEPMVERPAALAGVIKGDILVSVDGTDIPQPANIDEVTDLVRGPVGTMIHLTVLRATERLDFDIERAQIELPSVTWRVLDEVPGTGYIRLERFSGLTDAELKQALEELQANNANRALILDLRGNPGGLLDAAVAVSDHFLDVGPVLLERNADGSEQIYETTAGANIPGEKVVILIDGGTASASEIVAGALRDRAQSLLIGETTYGKGSIQRIHRLSDNSAVHVTFARWFTPNGFPIDGQGLSPDIIVDSSSATEDYDPYLETAIEQLRTLL